MSVYISNFDNADGTWTVTHDDAPDGHHSGQIQPTDVVRARNMDDSLNENFATVVCPVCGSASTHPVGGGAQPPLVQEMFIHLTMRDGCCAVGFRGAPRAVNYQDAHDHVKEHAEAMDGEGRWQVEPPPLPA